ncbi:hypothetical protein M2156_001328 [Streptomyces sp. SAI-149]|nr:hypothetical protein [Streptomyces sp. SAI-119]MDH6495109.1 hypothetical protein [Streptomyces sp. SAI-149]
MSTVVETMTSEPPSVHAREHRAPCVTESTRTVASSPQMDEAP